MAKTTAKFKKDQLKTVGGVAPTRYPSHCVFGRTESRTDGRTHFNSPLRLTSGDNNLHLPKGSIVADICKQFSIPIANYRKGSNILRNEENIKFNKYINAEGDAIICREYWEHSKGLIRSDICNFVIALHHENIPIKF